MSNESKLNWTLTGLIVGFLGLAGAFALAKHGTEFVVTPIPLVDPQFTNTATVRMSAAELARTGGDVSGLDCAACHEKGKTLVLKVDAANHAILPKEHEDLVMRHGRNDRNDNCFNCHDPQQLDLLVTRDGRKLKLTESTLLCGSCHGPTLRDWEAGIHGRTSGHWDRARGPIERQDCVSCHNPHSPAFPEIKPAPGPHPLHPAAHASEGDLKKGD